MQPHHVAQKSITTGLPEAMASRAVRSLNSNAIFIMFLDVNYVILMLCHANDGTGEKTGVKNINKI